MGPLVFTDQVDNAPPAIAHLDMLHRQIRQFGAPQSASEQSGEHGAVAQSFLRANVGRVQEGLGLAQRQPVPHAHSM
jgi:hypothetical protein